MNYKEIKKGDFLSTTMYMEVLSKSATGLLVKDSNNREFEIRGIELIEKSFKSASEVTKTEKITRTALAEMLTSIGDQVFTVNFDKQTGENRTLVGYKLSSENLMGRINAIDLTIVSGHNQRQVDLRTVKYVIINSIKYQAK